MNMLRKVTNNLSTMMYNMVRDMKHEQLPDAEDNNQQSVDDDVQYGKRYET